MKRADFLLKLRIAITLVVSMRMQLKFYAAENDSTKSFRMPTGILVTSMPHRAENANRI